MTIFTLSSAVSAKLVCRGLRPTTHCTADIGVLTIDQEAHTFHYRIEENYHPRPCWMMLDVRYEAQGQVAGTFGTHLGLYLTGTDLEGQAFSAELLGAGPDFVVDTPHDRSMKLTCVEEN